MKYDILEALLDFSYNQIEENLGTNWFSRLDLDTKEIYKTKCIMYQQFYRYIDNSN